MRNAEALEDETERDFHQKKGDAAWEDETKRDRMAPHVPTDAVASSTQQDGAAVADWEVSLRAENDEGDGVDGEGRVGVERRERTAGVTVGNPPADAASGSEVQQGASSKRAGAGAGAEAGTAEGGFLFRWRKSAVDRARRNLAQFKREGAWDGGEADARDAGVKAGGVGAARSGTGSNEMPPAPRMSRTPSVGRRQGRGVGVGGVVEDRVDEEARVGARDDRLQVVAGEAVAGVAEVTGGGVGGEDVIAWAQRVPVTRSASLDQATQRKMLRYGRGPSVATRVLKSVLCFLFPVLRHWGPFL